MWKLPLNDGKLWVWIPQLARVEFFFYPEKIYQWFFLPTNISYTFYILHQIRSCGLFVVLWNCCKINKIHKWKFETGQFPSWPLAFTKFCIYASCTCTCSWDRISNCEMFHMSINRYNFRVTPPQNKKQKN